MSGGQAEVTGMSGCSSYADGTLDRSHGLWEPVMLILGWAVVAGRESAAPNNGGLSSLATPRAHDIVRTARSAVQEKSQGWKSK
jgi:hypothetical protein